MELFNPGMMLVLGVIAVLLFGERLPEAAKTFGKKFLEVKKSIQTIQDELRSAATSATSAISSGMSVETSSGNSTGSTTHSPAYDESDRDVATAPKFVPPETEPQVQTADL
jgi:sec-independent protein translocase protein TatA